MYMLHPSLTACAKLRASIQAQANGHNVLGCARHICHQCPAAAGAHVPDPSDTDCSEVCSVWELKLSAACRNAGKKMRCNCKKTQCLKLHCECLAGQLSVHCSCQGCITATTSLQYTKCWPAASQLEMSATCRNAGKKMRCNCKKTQCLKLYCECFKAGQLCVDCSCYRQQNCNQTLTDMLSATVLSSSCQPHAGMQARRRAATARRRSA